MPNPANLITSIRFLLIPIQAYALAQQRFAVALALFLVAAVSDIADGVIARRFDLRTRFGAIADPLADKLMMLTIAVMLASRGLLPWWLAIAIVVRDLVIVAGALAYHVLIGMVELAPTWLSKINTGFEFLLVAAVMSAASGLFAVGVWLPVLVCITAVTIVLSGVQYVVVWGRKAAASARERRAG